MGEETAAKRGCVMSQSAIALNRFGLGARGGETPPADPKSWLQSQLAEFEPHPASLSGLPPRAEIASQLSDYIAEAQARGMPKRRQAMQQAAIPMQGEEGMFAELPDSARRFLRRSIRDQYLKMVAARTSTAMASNTPFAERLVHFWANHFAVSADKLPVIGMAGLLEFEAIRPNLNRRFADMLLAAEQHPAMLLYLDQAQSIGPDSQAAEFVARRRRQPKQQPGLNENLAREILELHTLGVNGGYTQADVTEFARAMTGWTIAGLARGPARRALGGDGTPGDFHFADLIHEPGERTIMGRRYNQEGEEQARAILKTLATHPATARHLATKLARHFAGDQPPPAMVDRLAQAYLSSGGDLPTVYRAIIDSPEAWAPGAPKFKTPFEWSVSVFRGLGMKQLDGEIAGNIFNQMGQPIWKPESPAGWDDIAASWAGPDALVRRVEVAEKIAQRLPSGADPRALASRMLPGALSEETSQAIARAESPAQGLALLFVSPEMLRR
jgi:uncharacterized protein (DUF1800 family)